jgi:hypothetical protein
MRARGTDTHIGFFLAHALIVAIVFGNLRISFSVVVTHLHRVYTTSSLSLAKRVGRCAALVLLLRTQRPTRTGKTIGKSFWGWDVPSAPFQDR